MGIDLGFQKGEFGLQLFIGDLFGPLFRAEPFVDDLDARAEDEYHEEEGDIARIHQRRISHAGRSSRLSRLRQQIAEQRVINAGQESIEDQQRQDDEGIRKEFLFIQQLRDDQMRIDVIKGNDEQAVDDKKGRKIPFGEEGKFPFPGPGIEYEGQEQETVPCSNMNDNLSGNFFQNGLLQFN